MEYQYKTIDISNLQGIKQAEKLHESGWKIISFGLYIVTFEKKL
jgi:hypothetical protein